MFDAFVCFAYCNCTVALIVWTIGQVLYCVQPTVPQWSSHAAFIHCVILLLCQMLKLNDDDDDD